MKGCEFSFDERDDFMVLLYAPIDLDFFELIFFGLLLLYHKMTLYFNLEEIF